MEKTVEHWSKPRQAVAQRISATLYGSVGIMTAELPLQPGEFGLQIQTIISFLISALFLLLYRLASWFP